MRSILLPSAAERGKRDEPSGGRQADHEKQREKQRVAVSQQREGEELGRVALMLPATDE